MVRRLLMLLPGLLLAIPLACQHGAPTTQPSYETVGRDPRPGSEAAVELDRKGVKLLDANDAAGAEKAFKAALEADMLYGPAHSNLGSLYFRQSKFYLASWEFEYAARLMPRKAAPMNNLGLVYERVGRLEDASKALEKALEREGDTMQVRGNLARVGVRMGKRDDATRKVLEAVARDDVRPEWRDWARRAMAAMDGKPMPAATTAPAKTPAKTAGKATPAMATSAPARMDMVP
jgi:Flp pilus assembly protein TadD